MEIFSHGGNFIVEDKGAENESHAWLHEFTILLEHIPRKTRQDYLRDDARSDELFAAARAIVGATNRENWHDFERYTVRIIGIAKRDDKLTLAFGVSVLYSGFALHFSQHPIFELFSEAIGDALKIGTLTPAS